MRVSVERDCVYRGNGSQDERVQMPDVTVGEVDVTRGRFVPRLHRLERVRVNHPETITC